MHLRGFSGDGASGAWTRTTATGGTASGTFRDAADFAVLVLLDRDDFFGHPRLKYLPHSSLANVVLNFDLTYTNLQTIDSAKSATIDWPYLSIIRTDGTSALISLHDNATISAGSVTSASGSFTVVAAGPVVIFDRVSVWFQNIAFDFTSPAGGETAHDVAVELARQINLTVYGGTYALSAVVVGATINITATVAIGGRVSGFDGNMIRMYGLSKNANLTVDPLVHFTGGSSAATWNIGLDFTLLGIDDVRLMWLTFAPRLMDSTAYVTQEWTAVIANIAITDPSGNTALRVAGANSVRVEDTDPWCTYTGTWALNSASGFFSKGFCRIASIVGATVTVKYWCGVAHDIYVGTSLYSDRGKLSCSLDGGGAVSVDCYLAVDSPVTARKLVASSVAAGHHTVVFTVATKNGASSANHCYFDFLEAANPTDVPAALPAITNSSPAIDYDTDHGYKLSPQRLMWMFDNLGFAGPMNLYSGVFWWNQRNNPTAVFPSVVVTIAGTYVDGDAAFLTLDGFTFGKSVFPADTLSTIAAHFVYYINETFVGVRASNAAGVITITNRSPGSAYNFTFAVSKTSAAGTISFAGSLAYSAANIGTWLIDPTQTPAINRGASDWHADLYAEVLARANTITTALSMELVNPPDDPGSGQVWAARYLDGTAVSTLTSFGGLSSTHCASGASNFLAYQEAAFTGFAALMNTAGLVPELQCGEFLWWFFPGNSPTDTHGMAYYDAETSAAALIALGRALHTFVFASDSPAVNAFADTNFLRNRLRDHVASIAAAVRVTYPTALFEALYPYDVNYPSVYGPFGLGGALNFYVNLPTEWKSAGVLNRIKIEALDFGSGTRSLDLVSQAVALAPGWGWPVADVRYLYPVFNGGCFVLREQQAAQAAAIPYITPFAMDHICLFGWNLHETLRSGAQFL